MFSHAIHEQETQQAFQRRSPTLLINFKNYDLSNFNELWKLIIFGILNVSDTVHISSSSF